MHNSPLNGICSHFCKLNSIFAQSTFSCSSNAVGMGGNIPLMSSFCAEDIVLGTLNAMTVLKVFVFPANNPGKRRVIKVNVAKFPAIKIIYIHVQPEGSVITHESRIIMRSVNNKCFQMLRTWHCLHYNDEMQSI